MSIILKYLETLLDFVVPATIILISIGFTLPIPEGSYEFWYDIPALRTVYNFESKFFLLAPLLLYTVSLFAKNARALLEGGNSRVAQVFALSGSQICIFVFSALFIYERLDIFSLSILGFICYMISSYASGPESNSLNIRSILVFLNRKRSVSFNGFILILSMLIPLIGGVTNDLSRLPQLGVYETVAKLVKAQDGIRANQDKCFRDDIRIATNVLFYTVYVGQEYDLTCALRPLLDTMLRNEVNPLGDGAILKEDVQISGVDVPAGTNVDFTLATYVLLLLRGDSENIENMDLTIVDFYKNSELEELLCQEYSDGTAFCLMRKQ